MKVKDQFKITDSIVAAMNKATVSEDRTMRKFLLFAFALTCVAQAQSSQLPLSFKGTCRGNTAKFDHTVFPDGRPIKCDSLTIMQIKGHTVLSFSNGDPAHPVLMFAGDLLEVHSGFRQPAILSIGAIGSAFPIAYVGWGDGNPMTGVHAPEQIGNDIGGRGCYFHFVGQGWDHLTEVECQLVLGNSTGDPNFRRVTVTFTRQ